MLIRRVFKLLTDLRIEDKQGYFRDPVHAAAPGVLNDDRGVISSPVDFSTIESRYHCGEYANEDEKTCTETRVHEPPRMIVDIRRVFENARLHNISPSNPIHKEAARLQALLEERWTELQKVEMLPSHTLQLQTCRKLINKMLRDPEEVQPFMQPVDASIAPDYSDVIRRPMCISIVLSKLNARPCQYDTSDDLAADVEQIWTNCSIYNGSQHPLSAKAGRLRNAFRRAFQREFGVFTLAHELECKDRCLGVNTNMANLSRGAESSMRKRKRIQSNDPAPAKVEQLRNPQLNKLRELDQPRVAASIAPVARPPPPIAAPRAISAQQRRLLIEIARKKVANLEPLQPWVARTTPSPPNPVLPVSSVANMVNSCGNHSADADADAVTIMQHRFVVPESVLKHMRRFDMDRFRPMVNLQIPLPLVACSAALLHVNSDPMLKFDTIYYRASQRLVHWQHIQLRHITIRLASANLHQQFASAMVRLVAATRTLEPLKFHDLALLAQLRRQFYSYTEYHLSCMDDDYQRMCHPMSSSTDLHDIARLFAYVPVAELAHSVKWHESVCSYSYQTEANAAGECIVHILCPDEEVVNIELNNQVLDTSRFSSEPDRLFVDAHANQLYQSWVVRLQEAERQASVKRQDEQLGLRLLQMQMQMQMQLQQQQQQQQQS